MQQSFILRFVPTVVGLSPLFVSLVLHSQGTFQNLNFELANLAGYQAGDVNVPISAALPGWSASIAGVPQFTVAYDNAGLDSSTISIMDGGFYNPISGRYSALLAAGF